MDSLIPASKISNLTQGMFEGGDNRESCACLKCKSGQVIIYRKVAKCNNESYGVTVFCNKLEKGLTYKSKTCLPKAKQVLSKASKAG